MPLYTTYLARRNKLCNTPSLLRSAFNNSLPIEFVFIARNRGNPAVEPPEMILHLAKEGAINWKAYRDAYLDSLDCQESAMWMQMVAPRTKEKNIVLVCFEGPRFGKRCHRFLLAEKMAQQYGVMYLGELSDAQ